jgi:hypothetical protein
MPAAAPALACGAVATFIVAFIRSRAALWFTETVEGSGVVAAVLGTTSAAARPLMAIAIDDPTPILTFGKG